MDQVRTILVASDRSEYARHAESRAKMLGAELKADTVEVMCAGHAQAAQDDSLPLQAGTVGVVGARAVLLGGREAMPVLVHHAARCPQGNTTRVVCKPAAIVERANEIDADLTVVPTRRESFLGGLISRFKSEELIRLSDRPVLLVHRKPLRAYRKVLVAVDFSAESQQAARMALAIAPGAIFTFLHVFRVPEEEMMIAHGIHTDEVHPCRIRTREMARLQLNSFINALGKRRQLISRAVEHGVTAPVIHKHAQEINADLIVVGKHGKSRFVELFLGSVTQRLIDYGDCDLLVTTSLRDEQLPMPPAA